MTGEFTIVKVHNDPIQPGGGVDGLAEVVNHMCGLGWIPAGGPFLNAATNHWCQAMHRPGQPAPAGEVPLREPADPRAPRVHTDPNWKG